MPRRLRRQENRRSDMKSPQALVKLSTRNFPLTLATCCAAILGYGCVLAVFAQQQPAGDRFYRAIRTNDLVGLRKLVSELGVNAEDRSGLTPLTLAAAFGTREAVSVLVEAGANVKTQSSRSGLTPLHVAWQDESVIRLLLDRGADVNAKTQLGATPLLVASSANGTEAVVSLLLEKGADPDAAEARGVTPLIAAAGVGNTAVAKLLLEHGASVNAYAPGAGQKTATPLMGAAHNGDVQLTRLLLTRKPDVNATSPDNDGIVKNGPVAFGTLTALHMATADASPAVVKLLLDAGASVNPRDARGLTPLMWAVGTDRPEPRIIGMLLDHGANASIASNIGETATDWARKYNNPAVMPALKLASSQVAVSVAASSPAGAELGPREAVERSLPLLRKASSRVTSDGGCVACHAQPLTAIATEYASRRGWRAEPATTDISEVVSALAGGVTNSLQGRESGGLPDTQEYGALMAAALNIPPNVSMEALVYYLAAKQRLAGNWHGIATRAPIQDGDISRTAMAIRTLAVYGAPARKADTVARITRAATWLAGQAPMSTEERVMQLLGLSWASAEEPLRERRLHELSGLQRGDGGWAQTPNLSSDAYATGQVLFTLRELGLPAADATVRRGVAFLVGTQAKDGSWFVKSRAMKIQPYFESGFPYGHDQWISQSGTAWATLALSVAAPEPSPVAVRR
jgi:ankyrin repeat protein